MDTKSLGKKYSQWNLLWSTLSAQFDVRDDYLEMYSLFRVGREVINMQTGEYVDSSLLNIFVFLSKVRVPSNPGELGGTGLDDLNTEFQVFYTPIKNLYSNEIEILGPVMIDSPKSTKVDLGYVIDNQIPDIKYKVIPRLQNDPQRIMLNDPVRFMELLLVFLLLNRTMIRKAKDKLGRSIYLLLTWEIASYMFTEIFYKDASVDRLYNERFRTLKFRRIVQLMFHFYFAQLDNPEINNTLRNIFQSISAKQWEKKYSKPVYDLEKKAFIMDQIIQPAGSGKQSIFTFSTPTSN